MAVLIEKDQEKSEPKYFNVTRIYSDSEGNSHFGTISIKMNDKGDIGSISNTLPCTGIMFRQTPPTYNYSWHTAPQRQFIVNLDAPLKVTVSSGETKILQQGEVFFVEDTHGKGHYSESVGNQMRHSLFLPVTDDYITTNNE